MFILTPIAINSPLTSKRAQVCIPVAIAASRVVSSCFSSFFSGCFPRISKRQREREEIEAYILLSPCEGHLFLYGHYVSNSNGEPMLKWVQKVVSKFHNNPTVNESEIIVLLRQVLGLYKKRESQDAKVIYLTPYMFLKIPMVRMLKYEF